MSNWKLFQDSRIFLWYYLFTFSKIVELGDTIFIVLRKQKLLTLHWVHHILTMNYTWNMMYELPSNSRWLCSMNFTVHSVMYTYYALVTSGHRLPPILALSITTIQIIQMFTGLITEVLILYHPCSKSVPLNLFGITIYMIFLLLFCKFFIKKYLNKKFPNKQKLI